MFDFDTPIDRRGTHALKWDMMQPLYGVPADDGIAMWVADMDFLPPPSVNAALAATVAHGIHGYFGDDRAYRAAITGWMARRHGWEVDPASIFTTHGVVSAFALCLQAFTEPGDAVILFTPVYHAFFRVLKANGRETVASELLRGPDGRYRMDLDALAAGLTGRERMLVLCSPHNPGGRVWTRQELADLADFCATHDLLLVADEIHHDLILSGPAHIPMPLAAPQCLNRLVMLTATTKTFNVAGILTGNVIIPEPTLRTRFAAAHAAAGTGPNGFGLLLATAAYDGGDAWLDALLPYLAGNAALLAEGLGTIPGVRPMPLDSTYLAWVDFAGTGMEEAEVLDRIQRVARVAPSHGRTFGPGGDTFQRFNIATPRARVAEAVARIRAAFADLQ